MRTVLIRIKDPGSKRPYQVQLSASDSDGTTPQPFAKTTIARALTLDEEIRDPEGQVLTVDRVRELYSSSAEPSDAFKLVGAFLYRLLARGKLGEEWKRLRAEAPDGTRTILDIASGPGSKPLRELPWERMYDPDSATHLFLQKKHSFVRGEHRTVDEQNPLVRSEWRKHSFLQDDWPLRVLVIFGAEAASASSEGYADEIGAYRELNQLERLFAARRFDVDWEVLEHPLSLDIVAKCEAIQPHVLHFIGHGETDRDPDQSCLKIWRPARGSQPGGYADWSFHDIRNDLQAVRPFRLAFLNACRTSASDADAAPAPFDGIVDAFMHLGALSVLGMQGNIPGDVAAAFACSFYEAVLDGKEIDVAATYARSSLSTSSDWPNPARRGAWSFPVLWTRVLPSLVLPRRLATSNRPPLAERFVTQIPQRRMVRDAVRARSTSGSSNAGPSPHLIVVAGEELAGKTHFAKWCAQLCERIGPRAAYVDFGEDDSWDIVDALRCLRDGIPRAGAGLNGNGARQPPLTPEAARRFTWELNYRLRGVDRIPKLTNDIIVKDEGLRLTTGRPDEGFATAIIAHFRIALEESAKPDGLLLVLDPVSRVQEAHRELLTSQLLRPIAAGNVPGVCALVVMRTNDAKSWLRDLVETPPHATLVQLEDYDPDDFCRVARHLCLQWAPDGYQKVRQLLPVVRDAQVRSGRWKAGMLLYVDQLCSAVTPRQP